jgi:DNA-binding LytR/AlgR family response regulator
MPVGHDLTGVCVLILEDDFLQAEDTARALRSAGASVVGPYGDEAQVLQAHSGWRPDCAVIDVDLGGGPTFAAARALAARGAALVFVSGYDREVLPADLSAAPFLCKPARLEALVQAVEAATRSTRV